MKITNRRNLPQPLVDAVQNDPYTKGGADFSATELIKPPFMRQLAIKHKDAIEVDVLDRIWSLYGQSVHTILERAGAGKDQYIVEKRYFAKISDVTISGQADVIFPAEGLIQDYKVTSVWAVKNGPKEEWVYQLNILAWLARQNVQSVNKLQIVAIMRDWSPTRKLREKDYPREKVAVVDIPLWDDETARAFILARIALHQDPEPPPCSESDRWQRTNKWAVMEEGKKRALKLHNSQDDAHAHLVRLCQDELAPNECELVCGNWRIEYRPGARLRCDDDSSASSSYIRPLLYGLCGYFLNFTNLDAEKAVLGSILVDNSAMGKVIGTLEPQDFSLSSHQAIYWVMRKMSLVGTPIDYLTLEHHMALEGKIPYFDVSYVSKLPDGCPSSANVEYHARIVKEHAVCRQVQMTLREGLDKLENGFRPEDIVAFSQGVADKGAAALEVKDEAADLSATYQYLEDVQMGKKEAVVDLGFFELRKYAPGTDELVVIAARPSTGKTAIALWMAEHIAKTGKVLFFSIEMSKKSINFRRMAAMGDISLDKLRRRDGLDDTDWSNSAKAMDLMKNSNVVVYDNAVDLSSIVAETTKHYSQGDLRAVFVDHLLLMKIPENDRRDLQLGYATGVLKRMCTRLQLPTFLLTQLNRQSEGREGKKPFLNDLRDSGVIEQDLDVCYLLHRPDRFEPTQKQEMLVVTAKNRNGPIGESVVGYSPATGRFWDTSIYD